MQQLTFFGTVGTKKDATRQQFSHDGLCDETARLSLESRYADLLVETDKFNRQLVSFQANKTEVLHSWLKYREGFSAELVELLFQDLNIKPGDTILDPFAGSATTLLTAKMFGVDAVGIELLPHCHLAWQVKTNAFMYDVSELRQIRQWIEEITPITADETFPHLTITQTAFPLSIEQEIVAYKHWFNNLSISKNSKDLCRLLLMSVLEDVSYTRKDGQYLRWDSRADKIRHSNEKRLAQGKAPLKGIDKGTLPHLKQVLLEKLQRMIIDITKLQRDPPPPSEQTLIAGNTLYTLPQLSDNRFSAVITSPPYANRYDYTRTYALELAYLGVADEIFKLRQGQLSCTVENKSKLQTLEEFYNSIGQATRFAEIVGIIQNNASLNEINTALTIRKTQGVVNNRGILTMIEQYFTELTFVFAELYRVCQRGASIVFVNDNVRYAGEVIPVDTISTNLAEQVGFTPHKIYVLPQRKGNSSQQMGRFGREALRKSITVWKKQ